MFKNVQKIINNVDFWPKTQWREISFDEVFKNVYKCSKMFKNDQKCSKMFTNVQKCSKIINNVDFWPKTHE